MKKLIALVFALAVIGCSSEGILSSQEGYDGGGEEAVVFYGVVTDAATGDVIAGATVEVYCETCEWNEATTTDEYGVYVLESESHVGHSGTIIAGTPWPGYKAHIEAYEDLTAFSNRIDFALEEL